MQINEPTNKLKIQLIYVELIKYASSWMSILPVSELKKLIILIIFVV